MDGSADKSQRNAKKSTVVLVAVLAVVIVIAAVAYAALAPKASEDIPSAVVDEQNDEEKDDAPDFVLTSVSGEEIQLSSFQGKPVILNFWASTCGPCRSEMPEFQSVYEREKDNVEFVMLNVLGFNGETKGQALQFIEQNGFTFPVYFDYDGSAQVLYGINSIPRTYFISTEGKIEAYAPGMIDKEVLEKGLAMIEGK